MTIASMYNDLYSGSPVTALQMAAGTLVGGTPVDPLTRLVTVPPASTTLAITQAAHGQRVVNLAPSGALAITLPAPTGSGVLYTFFISATVGGSLTIDAKGGDASAVFCGISQQVKTGTGLTTTASAANTNLITLNGTTTGGILGDLIEIMDVGTHAWSLFILGQYTGTFSSPLSNH